MALTLFTLTLSHSAIAETTRFCLEGKFDLGARYQGLSTDVGELYPARWCVTTESDSDRVQTSVAGNSNSDMVGDFTLAYFPPDLVRIVNRDSPPDVEFRDSGIVDEARRARRLDPERLLAEYQSFPERFGDAIVEHDGERLTQFSAAVDLPLRGGVRLTWQWYWENPQAPRAELHVDNELMFQAVGNWETLDRQQANAIWSPTPGADPYAVLDAVWPSKVKMELVTLADGVYLVKGVRSGFQHIVVETEIGLVIGDAPAGWVEMNQIPPTDLVPGLGVSGLSEGFVDFLKQELPGRDIAAVVLTHMHDDHAGGARAFAAEGAAVYAPAALESFLEVALNRENMPVDRLTRLGGRVDILPVSGQMTLGGVGNQVSLMPLDGGPHVDHMLGILAVDGGFLFVSDVHVPRSEDDSPPDHRAVTECWFARAVTERLSAEVRVVNSHSSTVTPVARLERYLESETCTGLN